MCQEPPSPPPGATMLVEGQDPLGPDVGWVRPSFSGTPLPTPPQPLPFCGGAPGSPIPGEGDTPFCTTLLYVSPVCYLHKALPTPQRRPPPSWDPQDVPSSTGAHSPGQTFNGQVGGGGDTDTHRAQLGGVLGISSTCRDTEQSRGGSSHPQRPTPRHVSGGYPQSRAFPWRGGQDRGTSGLGASPTAAVWVPRGKAGRGLHQRLPHMRCSFPAGRGSRPLSRRCLEAGDEVAGSGGGRDRPGSAGRAGGSAGTRGVGGAAPALPPLRPGCSLRICPVPLGPPREPPEPSHHPLTPLLSHGPSAPIVIP